MNNLHLHRNYYYCCFCCCYFLQSMDATSSNLLRLLKISIHDTAICKIENVNNVCFFFAHKKTEIKSMHKILKKNTTEKLSSFYYKSLRFLPGRKAGRQTNGQPIQIVRHSMLTKKPQCYKIIPKFYNLIYISLSPSIV